MINTDSTNLKPYSDFQELQDFQYNGYNYIYDLPPQQNNLFMMDQFYDPYNSKSDTDGYNITARSPDKIKYRIKKVSGFKLPSLEIQPQMESPFRWNYVATGRNKDKNTIKIDWIEDAFWSVKRYHMNWINHWYNKYLDCMVVGQEGKFRNMVLYLFHYKNLNEKTAIPIQKAVPIARFEFKGLIPESLPEGDLEWGKEVEPITTIGYTYNYLEIYFYPFTKDEREFLGGIADIIQKADNYEKTKPNEVWNTGIVGFTDTLEGMKPDGQFDKCEDGLHQSVYYI